jgi:Flp pilus assembly protein TadD
MTHPARRRRQSIVGPLVTGAALVLALAGCQTTKSAEDGPGYTGSIGSSAVITPSDLGPEEALAAVQRWGAAYTKDEKDKVAALNYAAALRAAGETRQGVAVMRKAAIYHPEDREVLAAYGKALAADGQFKDALVTVRRAQRADNPDWQLLATEGGILDSIGDHDTARDRYRQALVLAPGEPQILNNLGLSYVLTNDLDEAEKILTQAAASPKATLKTRQNLALVLKLRGKHAAAASVAPPAASASAATEQPPAAAALEPPAPEQEDTWEEIAASG